MCVIYIYHGLRKETTRLRDDKEHALRNKDIDLRGLRRAIEDAESMIGQLQTKVTDLESGAYYFI